MVSLPRGMLLPQLHVLKLPKSSLPKQHWHLGDYWEQPTFPNRKCEWILSNSWLHRPPEAEGQPRKGRSAWHIYACMQRATLRHWDPEAIMQLMTTESTASTSSPCQVGPAVCSHTQPPELEPRQLLNAPSGRVLHARLFAHIAGLLLTGNASGAAHSGGMEPVRPGLPSTQMLYGEASAQVAGSGPDIDTHARERSRTVYMQLPFKVSLRYAGPLAHMQHPVYLASGPCWPLSANLVVFSPSAP
jgi:hypothetical protein